MKKLLLVVAMAAVMASCSSNTVQPSAPPTPTPGVGTTAVSMAPSPTVVCNGGAIAHHSAPIVCLDANTLDATPDPARVHRGVWIHFYLNNQAQRLDIDFGGAPVEYKGKAGNEVWVRVKDQAQYSTYKYTAYNLDNGHSKDPDIVIEP